MSLFSNLLKTYEKCSLAAGIAKEDKDGVLDEKAMFLPLFHMTFKSQVCVTIDSGGNFIDICRDKKDKTIIIPCSEDSASRSSGVCAHPLCDQMAYVDKDLNEEKFDAYIEELKSWKSNNVKLNAVYNYLINNSIVSAMRNENLIKDNEKLDKIGVRFSVQVEGDNTPNVWEDTELRNLWVSKRLSLNVGIDGFDYLSGSKLTQIATKHPKNINPMAGNAKLLSCNDESGLTFRGRFAAQDEAVQIDAVTSQKMHIALKWLIHNYGVRTSTQAIAIWAVDSDTKVKIKPFDNSFDISQAFGDFFSGATEIQSDLDRLTATEGEIYADYSKTVSKALRGYIDIESLEKHRDKKIIIAIFDAATTGRMGVTFYQEFPQNEYLEGIAKWHEDCSWHLVTFVKKKIINKKGKEEDGWRPIKYIGCPSFADILEAAYGKPRGGNDKSYDVLKKNVQKQLLECMFGGFEFPKSYMSMTAARASNPMSFNTDNYQSDSSDWQKTVSVACALTRKYYKNKNKEDFSMELEKNRTDRDYLYGRLLAVADKLESTALYNANKSDSQKRATNAVKLMSAFVNKPYSTWGILDKQLNPYKVQLYGAGYYQSIIDEINVLFKGGEYEDNSPLSPLYLLGYSAQRRALSNKNKENQEELNNDNTTK